MSTDTFKVTVGAFEGPLDLLLSLIEERKMHVSDVSLSQVAESFITYVKEQPFFPVGEASQFIVIASTLLLIKSKTLLPVLSLTEEEEGDIKDLEHRLQLYKIFRGIGKNLGSLLGSPLYFGGLKKETTPLYAPSPDMNTSSLREAIENALQNAPKIEKKKEISVKTIMSLEDMMKRLSARIESALSMSFTDFVGSTKDRREVAVGFLAVLELVKQGSLLVEQYGKFADIRLEYAGTPKAPRYE
ncbi:hypothetical protein COU15_00215 [Candidatus Kaiserbacteria bacterium CG10_big_fil_rev_8_21_14_0_10_45_20]|uniref:Segregation and condensation protein A n=1 Tax=Candidatus Kaiserbacteria bacterium CG10_big_fil_rev_8_21_14_0_10_45_20 TaxID=1974607 RepID=A0A2H0UII2_9BACT|nr:MAG: hypothetical protein COU15_00215 [Candidatus Kaiserbacteria bacterium CG10_big_fil_rev_8_21_14_0_10_45_20]